MKMMIALALILSSSAGLAQTATGTPDGPPVAKAKPPKPICRSEPVTGSIFPQRTCHSKEEWTAVDAANAANAERMSAARNAGGSANH